MDTTQLQRTVAAMVQAPKGLLAADESNPTIARRFASIGLDSNEQNRRAWRDVLLTAPALADSVSGVILYEETLGQQADDGTPFPKLLEQRGIVPGVKVDKGKVPLANAPGDEVTEGLDGLAGRLQRYREQGARFAKWRAVYNVSPTLPSRLAVKENAHALARYAAICQNEGFVPIVEPEVLIDGDHTIERCREVTEQVLRAVFHALDRQRVVLEAMLLKPSMVLPGKGGERATPEAVAQHTVAVLRRTVPAAVPGVFFLSGGQSPEEATANLAAMNRLGPQPWVLSFSYARALQEPALAAWRGDAANAVAAQQALVHRARMNARAREGRYQPAMENEAGR
ncbi:MAG: fructose-bisphosphate aldolase class I [Burkholderiaceae bacterium]|nr:fructose-bisphosphate aldolase class I [Burkholderiaceae bacterium]